MKYILNKIVNANSVEEALKKARKIPYTEIYIHNSSWEKEDYLLPEEKTKKIGFNNKKNDKQSE